MDWVSCNSCCRQPGDERERTFMLSSCGHILCDFCLAQVASKKKCPICSNQCQYIRLSSKMKPDAEIFFKEPIDLLKQHHVQILRVLEFQKDHRKRLVSFHRKMLSMYKQEKKKFENVVEINRDLERENSRLKELLRSNTTSSKEAGGYSHVYTSPHDSYQKIMNSSSTIVSPQGHNQISPGRLTLPRNKTGGPPSGGYYRSPQDFVSVQQPQYQNRPTPGDNGFRNITPGVRGSPTLSQRSAKGTSHLMPPPMVSPSTRSPHLYSPFKYNPSTSGSMYK